MDEASFWRTMNPARLHALFSARMRQIGRAKPEAAASRSLSEYLMGG